MSCFLKIRPLTRIGRLSLFCTPKNPRIWEHTDCLQLFARNKDVTVKKPKLKPVQNDIRDLCSVSFWRSSGSFSSRLSAFLPEARPCEGQTDATEWPQLHLAQATRVFLLSVFPTVKWEWKPLTAPRHIHTSYPKIAKLQKHPEQIITHLKDSRQQNWLKGRERVWPNGQVWRCPLAADLGFEPLRHHLPLTRETHHDFERSEND